MSEVALDSDVLFGGYLSSVLLIRAHLLYYLRQRSESIPTRWQQRCIQIRESMGDHGEKDELDSHLVV